MPRRSLNNSEESPMTRRTSARIAAVISASPAKSPAKTPRRKRQSVESKNATEDTESQQSQIKSESSIEELNGIETSSSVKDQDSVTDSQDLPPKKSKTVDEGKYHSSQLLQVLAEAPKTDEVEEKEKPKSPEPVTNTCETTAEEPVDFEVVEKNDLPASDSAEVEAAVSVQGDGQILVGYVQVDKDELPSATSLEVQQTPVAENKESPSKMETDDTPEPMTVSDNEPKITNGNGHSHEPCPESTEEVPVAKEPVSCEVQAKSCPTEDAPIQPVPTPAAGDSTVNMVNVEPVPQ